MAIRTFFFCFFGLRTCVIRTRETYLLPWNGNRHLADGRGGGPRGGKKNGKYKSLGFFCICPRASFA